MPVRFEKPSEYKPISRGRLRQIPMTPQQERDRARLVEQEEASRAVTARRLARDRRIKP